MKKIKKIISMAMIFILTCGYCEKAAEETISLTAKIEGDTIDVSLATNSKGNFYKYYQRNLSSYDSDYYPISTYNYDTQDEKIYVLNVYAKYDFSGALIPRNSTYTTYDGETIQNTSQANILKKWMEVYNSELEGVGGKKCIEVIPVEIGDFNANPNACLYKKNGRWYTKLTYNSQSKKYIINQNSETLVDVFYLGTWDAFNKHNNLTGTAVNILTQYVRGDNPVLFGHDTLANESEYMGEFRKYLKLSASDSALPCTTNDSNGDKELSEVQMVKAKNSAIVKKPWIINTEKMVIPKTHSSTQLIPVDFIYCKFAGNVYDYKMKNSVGEITKKEDKWVKSTNFYVAGKGSCYVTQVGHSEAKATADEIKLMANLLFNLKQTTERTEITDYEVNDIVAPITPTIRDGAINGNVITVQANSIDIGSRYQYKVESFDASGSVSNTVQSNIVEYTSGIKEYRAIISDDASTTITASTTGYSVSNDGNYNIDFVAYKNKYLHVVAVDKAGNISGTYHYKIDVVYPVLDWVVIDNAQYVKGNDYWFKLGNPITIRQTYHSTDKKTPLLNQYINLENKLVLRQTGVESSSSYAIEKNSEGFKNISAKWIAGGKPQWQSGYYFTSSKEGRYIVYTNSVLSYNGLRWAGIMHSQTNPDSTNKTINIDGTAPTFEIERSTEEWTNQEVKVKTTAKDINGSGVKQILNYEGYSGVTNTFYTNGQKVVTAIDNVGNEGKITYQVTNIDKLDPIGSNIKIETLNDSQFKVSLNVEDAKATSQYGCSGIKEVKIPIWTSDNGQDDIKWYIASLNKTTGKYEVIVDKKNHNNATKNYIIHCYATDNAGNEKLVQSVNFSFHYPILNSAIILGNSYVNGNNYWFSMNDIIQINQSYSSNDNTVDLKEQSIYLSNNDNDAFSINFKENINNATSKVNKNIFNVKDTIITGDIKSNWQGYVNLIPISEGKFLYSTGAFLEENNRAIYYNNKERNSTNKYINIDGTAPTFEIERSTEEWTNQDVEVIVKAKDINGSGIKQILNYEGSSGISITFYTNGQKVITAMDNVENEGEITCKITNIDKLDPIGSNIETEMLNDSQFKVSLNVEDAKETSQYGCSGIKEVKIPIWTSDNGQDDIKWYIASFNKTTGKYEVIVDKKDHNNATKNYIIHCYAEDNAGNKKLVQNTTFEFPDSMKLISLASTKRILGPEKIDNTKIAGPVNNPIEILTGAENTLQVEYIGAEIVELEFYIGNEKVNNIKFKNTNAEKYLQHEQTLYNYDESKLIDGDNITDHRVTLKTLNTADKNNIEVTFVLPKEVEKDSIISVKTILYDKNGNLINNDLGEDFFIVKDNLQNMFNVNNIR